jgi:hypothetical protein
MMRWSVVAVLLSSCALPFVTTPKTLRTVEATGLRVSAAPRLSIHGNGVEFTLQFLNERDSTVVVDVSKLVVEGGGPPIGVQKVIDLDLIDGPTTVTLLAGARRRVTFLARLRQPDRFILQFKDAVSMNEVPLALEPLVIVAETEAVEAPVASPFQAGLRLSGGTSVGPSLAMPLSPSRLGFSGFVGVVEGYAGFFARWFEVNLVLRLGNGRLAGLEVGVRPGLERLTVFASYGVDLLQVNAGFEGERFPRLGHGPRAGVEWAFDWVQPRSLGVTPPRRFGVFLSGAASVLPGTSVDRVWFFTAEAGLRWRLL